MYILSKKEIKEILSNHGEQLHYQLGQNYLTTAHGIKTFIDNMSSAPHVIEIGPGIGNITINYFKDFKKVTLIELDEEKIPLLKETLTKFNDGVYPAWVDIIHGDILTFEIHSLYASLDYQFIGALPYNISKPIVHKALNLLPHPSSCTFILQREVADKYDLQAPDESFLSVSSKLFARIKKGEILKKGEFYPIPKVDSRIVTITDYTYEDSLQLENADKISRFIKDSFVFPRKKLSNTIKIDTTDNQVALLLQKRPQELSLDDWKLLFQVKQNSTP